MNISSRIKNIRKIFNLSQKDLAGLVGFSQSYVCGVENDIKYPGADFLLRISSVFGVSALWLSEGIGETFSAGFPVNPRPKPGFMIAENTVLRQPERSMTIFADIFPGFETGDLIFFEIEENNMEPLFAKGDRILIDPHETSMQNGMVYLFETNSRKTVKRCFTTGADLTRLTNDKPAIKNNDILFDTSIKCLGKVVWVIKKI